MDNNYSNFLDICDGIPQFEEYNMPQNEQPLPPLQQPHQPQPNYQPNYNSPFWRKIRANPDKYPGMNNRLQQN